MRTVEVEVTAEDIEQGCYADAIGCPVALALLRAGLSRPFVVDSDVACFDAAGDPLGIIDFPPDVQKWIRQYDQQRRLGPFRFELGPFRFALEVPENCFVEAAHA